MLSALLSRQILYLMISVPVGFVAFYFVDWYWFDGTCYPAVVTQASNILSYLM